MKTQFLPVIFLPLILSSCYTTKITSDFLFPDNQNIEIFSQLDIQFNDQSFASVFAPSKKIVDAELIEGEFESRREVQVVNESRNSLDVKNLIEKYAIHSTPESGCCKGAAVFSVTFYDFKKSDVLPTISITTFGVLNLAGLPSNHVVQTIELKVSFYNNEGKLLKSYTGLGSDKYLTGVYYHSPNQKRPSFIKCVKNAISEIEKQITTDKQFLLSKLQE